MYSGASCQGTILPNPPPVSVSVTAGGAQTPASFTINTAGTYSIRATYGGDLTNLGSTSTCEGPVTVSKLSTSVITTSIQPSASITVGQTVHDTASLGGTTTANAVGTVTYTLYGGGFCAGSVLGTSIVPVTNANVPDSKNFVINNYGTGSDSFKAVYSGDANNVPSAPACEVLTVAQAIPSISTTLIPPTPTILVGQKFTDTATLSSATATAGGSVTYTVFTDSSCLLPTSVTVKVTVINGKVPNALFAINTAGTYYVGATYSGDANNAGPVSSTVCEGPVTVTAPRSATSLTISVTPPPLTVGISTLTVSGALTGTQVLSAAGTVTYQFFSGTSCAPALLLDFKSVSVSLGSFSDSAPKFTLNSAGTFSVNAVFSPTDLFNNPSTSACKSPITVNRATVTITTVTTPVTPVTAAVGSTVTDLATLGGATGTAGGSVTYQLFSGTTCAAPAIQTNIRTVTGGTVASSSPFFVFNKAGTYSMLAVYTGDTNNLGATSLCESPITITITTPGISTTVVPASPLAGSPFVDTVTGGTLTGVTSNAGGTVTYSLYVVVGIICTGSALGTSTVTVTNGNVPSSKNFVLNNVGSYGFVAVYSGDANNGMVTGTCEPFTVGQATPSISTLLILPTTILASQSVTDSSTLSGKTTNAGGTVTYTLYTDNICTSAATTPNPVAVNPVTVTVTNGLVPTASFTIDQAGTYYIHAVYGGDTNNAASSPSSCEGAITVNKASPTVSTQLSPIPVITGGTITDTATLTKSSGSNAGGTIDFHVYTGGTCSGTSILDDLGEAVTTNVATSIALGPLTTGQYSLQAHYNGDANNNAATSPCEPLFVKAQPTLTLTAPVPEPAAQPFTVTAALGSFTNSPSGSVTYSVFTTVACPGSPLKTNVVAVTGGLVPNGALTINLPGTYYVQASYSGDSSNAPATSACSLQTVNMAAPSLSTQLSTTSIKAGGSLTDTATLTLATSNAGGTVTYTVYTDNACTLTAASPNPVAVNPKTVAVTNGNVPSASFTITVVSTYYVQASYSGDPNNSGPVLSTCEGAITVNLASPTISTQLSFTTIVHGGSVTDTATLAMSSGSNAAGTVDFNLYSGSTCSGIPVDSDLLVSVTGNAATSKSFTVATAGTYSFRATYSGDPNNNGPTSSACEILIVT